MADETTTGRRYQRRPDEGRSRDYITNPHSRTRRTRRQAELKALKDCVDCRDLARAHGLVPDSLGQVPCFSFPGTCSRDDDMPSCSVGAVDYWCFKCNTYGDAIDLIRAVRGCSAHVALKVLRQYVDNAPVPPPHAAPSVLRGERAIPPPLEEVEEVWASGLPVGEVPGVAAWLREQRGIDLSTVEALDLARALPHGVSLPCSARIDGVPWTVRGYRLIVPCYDATGRFVTLRAVNTLRGKSEAKEVGLAGSPPGSVMASSLAKLMLSGGARDGRSAAEVVTRVGVAIAGGVRGFLSRATRQLGAAENARAVIGLYSGALCAEVAERIPDGAPVVVATDYNKWGDGYATEVMATLQERVRAGRLAGASYKGPGYV